MCIIRKWLVNWKCRRYERRLSMLLLHNAARGILSFALTLLPLIAYAEGKPEQLNARQILTRMAETYANCKTYQDTGIVKTSFIGSDRDSVEETRFSTAFVRPDEFRFEYLSKNNSWGFGNRYIIWCKGHEVLTWWSIDPGTKREQSLALAVASATGVSSGSAHTIPALLLPNDISGR